MYPVSERVAMMIESIFVEMFVAVVVVVALNYGIVLENTFVVLLER